jgi:class 3 adenylate cyclase/pimeloyl-ACP methyl ester carboxylesterase
VPKEVGEATAHPRVDILPGLIQNRFVRESFRGNAMEPRIQYAKTADGVSIAFWTLGEGTPFVLTPAMGGGNHIELLWQWPEYRASLERLAQKRRVVGYDLRGFGLSDRGVTDFSLDSRVADLEAVVDRLELDRFILLGTLDSGPVAIVYATRHPGRVSHLVLWCAWARYWDVFSASQYDAVRSLVGRDWELYTETLAHAAVGWSESEAASRSASLMRESVAPEVYRAAAEATSEFDVIALLPRVRSPTLVFHRRQFPLVGVDVARGLASRIPDARLVLVEGASGMPFLGETETLFRAIDEFLGEGEKIGARAEPPAAGAFRTVVFTDVEGSTALTRRLGDAKAREVLRTHERIVRDALRAHACSEVKALGDGFMASFSSATRALECAIAMQRAFAEHNESAQEPIRVRIGLNAGEPIAEDEDLFGTAVILAARIAAKAGGGEILTSDVVRQLVAGKGFLFSDRGDVVLRGFEDPVRLHEVRWRED